MPCWRWSASPARHSSSKAQRREQLEKQCREAAGALLAAPAAAAQASRAGAARGLAAAAAPQRTVCGAVGAAAVGGAVGAACGGAIGPGLLHRLCVQADPGRVVAAVLQSAQPREQALQDLPPAVRHPVVVVSKDATHPAARLRGQRRGKGRGGVFDVKRSAGRGPPAWEGSGS